MIKFEHEITTQDIAEAFSNAGSDEQADFFHEVGLAFNRNMTQFERDGQMLEITKDMSQAGANFIYALANWMKAKGIKGESPKFDELTSTYPEGR